MLKGAAGLKASDESERLGLEGETEKARSGHGLWFMMRYEEAAASEHW